MAIVSIKPSHLDLWVGAKMIEEFNKFLNEKMTIEEEIALKNVGR